MMNSKSDKKGAGKFLRNLLGVSAAPKLHGVLGFMLALLLAGCAVPVSAPQGAPAGGGLGTVRVEVSGFGDIPGVSATPKLQAGPTDPQGPQRTVYPTPPTERLKYTYTWKTSGMKMELQPEQYSPGNFILALGTYTLDVKAYVTEVDDADANLVGTGVGTVDGGNTTITVGGSPDPITVTVALKPQPLDGTGTGTLAYTIKYPTTATVLSLTLQNLGDVGWGVANLTPTDTPTTTLTGTTDVPAGNYLLRAKLWNDARVAGMSETVRIYDNMTTTVPNTDPAPSAASFAFTAEDFTVGDPAVTGGWTGGYTVQKDGDLIKSITLTGGKEILIGRKENEQVILKIDSGGNLQFRDAVGGSRPIGSYAEFQLMGTSGRSGTYKQEADLDLMGDLSPKVEWTAVGTDGANFTGTFDGGGKAISNLYIDKPGEYQGLFGFNSGTVKNVHIASGSVKGSMYVGSVAGQNNGIITACTNTGSVSGNWHSGGVVGRNSGTITACSNTGSVTGSSPGVGGVVGFNNNNGAITACYNIGAVSGNDSQVGGVAGINYSTITACYNSGAVTGKSQVGGVAGHNYRNAAYITACYSTGAVVSGDSLVGGVAFNNGGTITACYWKDVKDDSASKGIGYGSSEPTDTNATQFSGGEWPSTGDGTGQSTQWGIGDGSGSGKYWKDLGGWNGGDTDTVYPTLWWQ
jgi:hypothetical protein